MVALVIVSHSATVAEGIVELAGQVAGASRLVAAGGMEDGSIGTDATLVVSAVEDADDGTGVCILADLGSGVMSAETAIELLEDSPHEVRLADAPILEGAIAAAVAASTGAGLDAVVKAAEQVRGMRKLR